ncbi:LytR/AlgR family response regulator transcription factor [Chitinophaga sp. 30R24]|uniref:LytR/AlgR family response regulator transcription factor n=1 Tax=Chitinophaga sp. 30R24 TaxID=3248838 RepID=UPI003B900496
MNIDSLPIKNSVRMLPGKILVPDQNMIYIVSHTSILFFKSDNYYSHVYLSDGRNYLLVKTLSKVEKEIQEGSFIRISQSFLVNINFITSIDKKKKVICLSDQHLLPFTVPVKKLTELILNTNVSLLK